MKAPKAPIPAASVGLNMPPYIPPITNINSVITPHTPLSDSILRAHETRSPGGPNFGLILITT